MTCQKCGTENESGRKYCGECGVLLAVACTSCGAANSLRTKFCGECGSPLRAPSSLSGTQTRSPPKFITERRLVSVLFADLVGFTALSEHRDAEEVRQLLDRYYDVCRRLIDRYGGTVEKYIGDAVMAVWGTPIAHEDDAERAVRAALDITAEVTVLGQEIRIPGLKARAGVLTGEAAVTIGAEGQGMVSGDLVNTASRIQGVAEPSSVLVGSVTRRATEAAIVYQDAGAHRLKGKADPVHLWRAVRVAAAKGGTLKPPGLDPPSVGREWELRVIKELFHTSAEERQAHLVLVMGAAGIGKSQLSWEFFKYFDGLAANFLWLSGRCLAREKGVTYWALAEMVKMWAGIEEKEEPSSALAKVKEALEQHLTNAEERRWVEPRLAHLLGTDDQSDMGQEAPISAWSLLFERLAEDRPTVLVFEDVQWAEAALLDFIDYLGERSRNRSLFVLILARPELTDRHPNWAVAKRRVTPIFLEPLSDKAMEELLAGLVPGLPSEISSKILEQAEGVPLYAVETVRGLLGRGLLVEEGASYRPTRPIQALEVPQSLQGLIMARLDNLMPQERTLILQASVLGKTFPKQLIASLTKLPEGELQALLASLMRKELFSLETDPRSPERGQYGFLQNLVRMVAYEQLSLQDRKALHLEAAACRLQNLGGGEEEPVEVIASHYLEAYLAAPNDEDAVENKARARDMLIRAGERAASLAATGEAQRFFEQAAELADEPLQRAELLQRAGGAARRAGRVELAKTHLTQATSLFESQGRAHRAARVSARLAEVEWDLGHLDTALERMERAYAVLARDGPAKDLADVANHLGWFRALKGQHDLAAEPLELALALAEALQLRSIFCYALNNKAFTLMHRGRPEEALILLEHALKVALDKNLPTVALRSYNYLALLLEWRNRYVEALEVNERALELARRIGDPVWETTFITGPIGQLISIGRWDEALGRGARAQELREPVLLAHATSDLLHLAEVHIHRGDLEEASRTLDACSALQDSDAPGERNAYFVAHAAVLRAEGKHEGALAVAEQVLSTCAELGMMDAQMRRALLEATEAAFSIGELEKVQELLDPINDLHPGNITPFLEAQRPRLLARLALARGERDRVETKFEAAAAMFRDLGTPFWLAVTLLEHGEWLVSSSDLAPAAEPLLAEAGRIFSQLRAEPWLYRLANGTGA